MDEFCRFVCQTAAFPLFAEFSAFFLLYTDVPFGPFKKCSSVIVWFINEYLSDLKTCITQPQLKTLSLAFLSF